MLLQSRPPARRWSWTASRTSRSSPGPHARRTSRATSESGSRCSWSTATGCGSEADFLAALGQRAYYVPSVGGGLEGDPRLLGYTQPDEPDSHGIGPAQLEDVPGRISFLTLTTGFLRALPRYADPAARDLYGAYRAKADMFGVAVYPLSHLCGVTALSSIYEIQRDLVAFATGKPTFQWLEAGDLEGACGAPVTPQAAEPRHGWRSQAGRVAWAGSPTDGRTAGAQSFAIADDVAASIAETNARLQSLAPVLLSPWVRMAASTRAEPVKLGARAHAELHRILVVRGEPRTDGESSIGASDWIARSFRRSRRRRRRRRKALRPSARPP